MSKQLAGKKSNRPSRSESRSESLPVQQNRRSGKRRRGSAAERRKSVPPLVVLPLEESEPLNAGDAWESDASQLRNLPALQSGVDAYAPLPYLNLYRRDALRYWSVAGRLTSLQMPGHGMVKAIDRFAPQHTYTPEAFQEFIREAAFYGCPRPTSYGSIFHTQYRSPRVRWSLHAPFADHFAGGWQQARMTGDLPGKWIQYDLNSAYLWACSLGLPNVRSLRVSRHIGRWPGMYALELVRADDSLPYPFNLTRWVNATTEEIDLYSLPIQRILGGVVWSDEISGDPIIDTIRQFTFAKEVARSFWGRWCSTTPVECTTASGAQWELRNPIQNFVWAHLIIARVKARVFAHGMNAAHIFVDSLITTDELPTGNGLGDWRKEREFNGLRIRHAGYYGDAENWTRTSGASAAAR